MLTLLALGGLTVLVWGATVCLSFLDERQAELIGVPLPRAKLAVGGMGRRRA